MTLTELMEIVADRTGAEPVVAHGFVQSFIDVIIERLDAGDEVKVRGLGTFKWVDVPGKLTPIYNDSGFKHLSAGKKLKFFPAKQFKTRRVEDVRQQRQGDDKTRSGTR